jgi:hypothetical protein
LLAFRWMLVFAALLSSWAAAVGAGASGGDRVVPWRVLAPVGPAGPALLEGGLPLPVATESRGNKVGGGGDGAGAALVSAPITARVGRTGWRALGGPSWMIDDSARAGGRWTRGPPRG